MMYRIECYNREGYTIAVAHEVNGSLVVQGDMNAWRETAATLLPLVKEAAGEFQPEAGDLRP